MNILKFMHKDDWIFFAIVVIFVVGQAWMQTSIPGYMSDVTTLIKTGDYTMSQILVLGFKMLGCTAIMFLLSLVVGYASAKISATVAKNMRSAVFNKVQSYGVNEIKKFSIASLITRTTNDITQIQNTIAMTLRLVIKAPVISVWVICIIAGKSWEWCLTTACAVAILLLMIVVLVVFAIPKFKKMQVLTDNVNRVTRENLTGLRVVRAYNAESYEDKKFDKANTELANTNLFVSKIMSILSPGMTMITSGMSLAIYWIGAYLITATNSVEAKMGLFSDMVVFMSYAMLLLMAFIQMIVVIVMLPRAIVAIKRIAEVIDTDPIIKDGEGNINTTQKGIVEFKNVSFKYPGADEYVLKNINFTVNKGETIAFIGSTGSGKSTLINLVPRLYDATEGEVLVDGVNVKNYKQNELLNKIGYVSQKAILFSGSVKENVEFGTNGKDEFSEENLQRALKISQSSSFVNKMEEKENSNISQSGMNVSGGQKQRLSIARAIARNPEICVFDDSFSALDYRTDKALRDSLKKQNEGVTNLIVAQRIGTIKDADQIIVLDNGEMVGHGTHDELLKNCKVYKEIALSQLTEEELKNE